MLELVTRTLNNLVKYKWKASKTQAGWLKKSIFIVSKNITESNHYHTTPIYISCTLHTLFQLKTPLTLPGMCIILVLQMKEIQPKRSYVTGKFADSWPAQLLTRSNGE